MAFDNFFLPSDAFLTLPILLQAQKYDPVLSTVYTWLKQKQRPHSLTPIIKANSFLYTYYKQFQHLYIDPNSHLIQYCTPIPEFLKKLLLKLNPLLTRHVYVYHLNFSMPHLVKHILMATPVKNSSLKLLTNFIFFLTYLYGSQSSSMTVLTARQTSIFQLNPKTFLLLFRFMKALLTLITEFLWTLKVLLTHLLKTTHIFVIIDAFSHFVVTNPAPNITSKYAIQTLLHHWITKFGPPQYLVTDRGTEYINQDMAHLCSLFHFNH